MSLNIIKPKIKGNYLFNETTAMFAKAVINGSKSDWKEVTEAFKAQYENKIEDELSTKINEE